MKLPARNTLPTLVLAGLSLGLTACLAPRIVLDDTAARVETGEATPTGGLDSLGPIEAVDGEGCGVRGYEGTYEAALVRLKNEAARRAADYVQITGSAPPTFRPGCFDNRFTLTGIAYRRPGGAVSATLPVASSPMPPRSVAVAPLAPVAPSPSPTVVPTPVPMPMAPPADGPVARKLLELQELRTRNLISPEEYERLRRKVLSEAY